MKIPDSASALERLWWEIPLATFIMGSGLFLFSAFLAPPKSQAPVPVTLDAEIANIGLTGSARTTHPRPIPPKPPVVRKTGLPKMRPKSLILHPSKPPSPKSAQSRPSQSPPKKQAYSRPPKPAIPDPASTSRTTGPGAMDVSAQAYDRPMPRIPDSLLGEEIDTIALARFRVKADGTSTVELVQATNEPSLNRAILEALRRWRFQPAIRNGKPVESTVELRIPIEVR